jgi:hypothetical protein
MNETSNTYYSPFDAANERFDQAAQGWQSLSVRRTTSFVNIQKEVAGEVMYDPNQVYTTTPVDNEDREYPDGDYTPTGQLKPGSPIGDMLLPMMAMALIYFFVKLFRNRKTSHTL